MFKRFFHRISDNMIYATLCLKNDVIELDLKIGIKIIIVFLIKT